MPRDTTMRWPSISLREIIGRSRSDRAARVTVSIPSAPIDAELTRPIGHLVATEEIPGDLELEEIINQDEARTSCAVQLFEPVPEAVYPIEAVVLITQLPRHLIAVYCRHGLIAPIAPPERAGWLFDGEAIRELRYLQQLRGELRLDWPALCVVVEMRREIERLKEKVRLLRGRE